jgi:hypothetical protein
MDEVFKLVKSFKKENETINVISTVAIPVENQIFRKEFKNLGYLVIFVAGLTMGETKTMEKLDKEFLE